MFSRVPVPKAKWEKANMKYVLCFFPAVGLFIGICELAAARVCAYLNFSEILRAAVLTLLPVILTGGIHLDGFTDTCDGLHSWQNREKKLEILDDPHIGAFAAISLTCYMIFDFALWYEANETAVYAGCMTFVLSRALSSFAAVRFKSAKNNGLLFTFKDGADVKFTAVCSAVWFIIFTCALTVYLRMTGFICSAAALGVLAYYRHMAYKYFGGTTGDLAGYFLQVCELSVLFAAVLLEKIL